MASTTETRERKIWDFLRKLGNPKHNHVERIAALAGTSAQDISDQEIASIETFTPDLTDWLDEVMGDESEINIAMLIQKFAQSEIAPGQDPKAFAIIVENLSTMLTDEQRVKEMYISLIFFAQAASNWT